MTAWHCYVGRDPEFLRAAAGLFLGFSGGTAYGSRDAVATDISYPNRLLYALYSLGLYSGEAIQYRGPSSGDYRQFEKFTLPPFPLRNMQPVELSIEGPDYLAVGAGESCKTTLAAPGPPQWREPECLKFVKYRWTERVDGKYRTGTWSYHPP